MARPIDTDLVFQIISALGSTNASSVVGMSVAELQNELPGKPNHQRIRRILDKPEFGFRTAVGRTNSGALTYYHDFSLMEIATPENPNGLSSVSPMLNFNDPEKLSYMVSRLSQVIGMLDPTHSIARDAAIVEAKEKAAAIENRKGRRDFFDYIFGDLVEALSKKVNAKQINTANAATIEWYTAEGKSLRASSSIIHIEARSLQKIKLKDGKGLFNDGTDKPRPEEEAYNEYVKQTFLTAIRLLQVIAPEFLRLIDEGKADLFKHTLSGEK